MTGGGKGEDMAHFWKIGGHQWPQQFFLLEPQTCLDKQGVPLLPPEVLFLNNPPPPQKNNKSVFVLFWTFQLLSVWSNMKQDELLLLLCCTSILWFIQDRSNEVINVSINKHKLLSQNIQRSTLKDFIHLNILLWARLCHWKHIYFYWRGA